MTKAEALLEEQLESVSQRGENTHRKYSRYAVCRKTVVPEILHCLRKDTIISIVVLRYSQNVKKLQNVTAIKLYTSFVINFMKQSSSLTTPVA
jgi:hypothetical protein